MDRTSVLLADDNKAILARVCTVLGDEFEIVAAVNNGRDAVKEVERLKPHVLVIDISMPVLNGLDAVACLRSKTPTKIIFLTVNEDPEFVAAAFAAGGSAYVTKANLTTDLVPAIRRVLEGGKYLSQSLASCE
jgi:DNA-binding NarL/FixJ family response regulator